MAVQYSILVDAEFDTRRIQDKLNKAAKGVKVNVQGKKEIEGLGKAMEDTSLTFQAANEVFSKSIDVISSMVEQVFEMDSALTEFKKVSDLSGESLDDYVDKLTKAGGLVARTGKPERQTPVVGMKNQQQELLEIQYNLRAYSTTMVA